MSYISCGECKKKYIFLIISIIFCLLIYQAEYHSAFQYDCGNINTPQLFSLHVTFSFLSSIFFGGIFYVIIEKKLRDLKINVRSKENEITKKKKKKSKKKSKKKKSIALILLYEEKYKDTPIPFEYFILSTFLELTHNFATFSVAFDFIDIESKMLFNGFEIIIIKIIGKILYKNSLYRHQIVSIIILLCLLIFGIIYREEHLLSIINSDEANNNIAIKYIKTIAKKKFSFNIVFFYFIFTIVGNITSALSVCYDNWLMNVKFCSPYKLLLIKGLLGIIPAFSIQTLLYHFIGEKGKFEEVQNIDLISIIKRASFPFSSFSSSKNIPTILIFFFLVGVYQFSIIYTNNKFYPEFVGLAIISSSGLSLVSNEIVNIILYEKDGKIFYFLPFFYFFVSLITSLIICEVIILHFCGCDKNTAFLIDKRGIIESINSFRTYLDDELKGDKSNCEDFSIDSKDND